MTDTKEAAMPEARPPYKRLPPEERGEVPDLPIYPGLPSETGMTTAIFVRRRTKATEPPVLPEEPQEMPTEEETDKAG